MRILIIPREVICSILLPFPNTSCSSPSRTPPNELPTQSQSCLLYLICNPLQEGCALSCLVTSVQQNVSVRHAFPLALLDLGDVPAAHFSRLGEELNIFFETPVATLGQIVISPDSSKSVCTCKDEVNVICQVVEHDRRDKRDGKVGQAPDDDTDSCSLRTSSCWEYLSLRKIVSLENGNSKGSEM